MHFHWRSCRVGFKDMLTYFGILDDGRERREVVEV